MDDIVRFVRIKSRGSFSQLVFVLYGQRISL